MSQNLYARAQEIANQAVINDDAGNYEKAFNQYLRAAEILVELKKLTTNSKLQLIYENKAKEYVLRARKIKPDKKSRVSGSKGSSNDNQEDDLDKTLEDSIVSEIPNIKLSDVAGLIEAKRALREAIVLPLKRPDLFTGSRQPWKGILLHGPPGCGKTMIAKATAGDVQATFFNISAATLVSKWLGESEKLVKRLYDIAIREQPSIIFIDEVDSLTQSRSEGENDAMRRVKTQLLTSMEGLSSNSQDRVVTIGATNVPWEIDTAFRRRFQRRIYVSLPDIEAREVIFKINSKGIELDDDIDFAELASLTDGYSGSDIANICKEAIMAPIRDLDQSEMIDDESIKARPVNHSDYLRALSSVNKSVSVNELSRFSNWDEEFSAG
ncbi:MAG: AAA family ATPase [Candidatus Heimdallarchaeota archaeon]|nr:AAA family ATPase [Candidatus Heimdallarchaeota archaeon]